MRRIFEIFRKELLQLRRDTKMLPMLFVAPVIQLVLLGYAATTDLAAVPVVVCDQDRSQTSRELLRSFSSSGDFHLSNYVERIGDIDQYLDNNQAEIGIVVPSGFGRAINSGESETVQILVDGSKTNATTALNQLLAAVGDHAGDIMSARLVERGIVLHRPSVNGAIRVWYNPELASRNFMVPAVLALILLVITTVITSMAIVKEKESGTIEQIIVTPIRPIQLIIGKLLPFALVGLVEILLVLSVTIWWFDIPLKGNAWLLIALCMLFLLTTQGLGLFVSTISHNQQQAMMTAVFFVIMPMVLLSGFVFPIEDMPEPIQYVTYLMPLRYFLIIIRGIFLKGVGMDILWPQVALLAGLGVVILGLAVARFQKRIA